MNHEALMNAPDLQRIALACLDSWNAEPLPLDQRSICYKWVARRYATMFGGSFHQARLVELERLGFLAKDDTSRGGDRRYYRLTDPVRVVEILKSSHAH